ncbi:MAG: hypothetical protein ACJATW_000891 [Glaciecola sp.]
MDGREKWAHTATSVAGVGCVCATRTFYLHNMSLEKSLNKAMKAGLR